MNRTLLATVLVLTLCLCLAERPAAAQLYDYNINTAVGSLPYGNGGAPAQALITYPYRVMVASTTGAIYIADTYDQMVRKVVGGQITTIAGNGTLGYSGDGKAATSAQLNYPTGLAMDATGNLYIYDTNNEVIRKVDTNGIITTFAGTGGKGGSTGDGGPATQAKLFLDTFGDLAVDSAGNLYISDLFNAAVRKVTVSTGIISTVAGIIGKSGTAGDGGPATSANLTAPAGLAFDAAGDLYIADVLAHTVRMVSAKTGNISTVAGTPGKQGFAGNGGVATAALLNNPSGIAVSSSGVLYIADSQNAQIRAVSAGPGGTISTVAGEFEDGYKGDGGPATQALLYVPEGVAVDSTGTLYIADTYNSRIRTVSQGTIAEFAGTSHLQDGTAASGVLYFPQGIAWDAQGNLYIADSANNAVRKVGTDGKMSTIAGTGSNVVSGDGGPATQAGVYTPQGVAVDGSGNVYISTGEQIRMVDSAGNISTIVNTANAFGFAGDGGPATAAKLAVPNGLATDSANNLYIADSYNHRIRKVSGGAITTVAGSGPVYPSTPSFAGDGGPATSANLAYPYGVAIDSAGNMLIADTKNFVIRKVDATSGNISTIAGTGTKPGYAGDLGPATSAMLINPLAVAADHAGNIVIADGGNDVVRLVDGLGVISTIAGNNTLGFSGDGGPADSAQTDYPYGIGADPSGNIWFADFNNQRIRELTPSGPLVPGASSVVNGASFVSGGLVPGGIATVFGSRLTTGTGINETSGLPLQTQFMNVSVKINGKINAPLFAVDSVNGAEQINFQVPWELAGQTSAVLQVVDNGVASPTVTVPVLAAQPGIFAILHANYQPVTTANPATDGEVLLIYCTNLGAVSPTVADGAAGTGKELTVATTTVMMGSGSAAVSFSGLASGFVGLYQVNAQVPAGLAAGARPVVVSAGGVSSSAVMIAVK